MTLLEYRGYESYLDYSSEDKLYFGKIENIRDLVTYHGCTPQEAIKEFNKSVDIYLDFCKELHQEPDVPTLHYSKKPNFDNHTASDYPN